MSKIVKEMAIKYYPIMWDDARINALVKAKKLTESEAKEIQSKK